MSKENKKSDECDCCGFVTKELTYCESGYPIRKAWLCKICYCTHAGNAFFYPTHYQDAHAMSHISYCTNLILSEIKKTNKA